MSIEGYSYFRTITSNWQIFVAIYFQRNLWLLRFSLLAVLCGCIVSCNDPPSPVGSGTLPTETTRLVTISSDTLPLITSSVVGQFTPKITVDMGFPDASNPAFIGSALASDIPSTRITSTTFLSFSPLNITDSARKALFDGLNTNDILSAVLLLSPARFILGDSLRPFSPFRIHSLRRPWYTDNLQQTLNIEDPSLIGTQVGLYQNSIPGSTFIDASQTLTRKLPLQILDKQLIIRWLQANDVTWQSVDGLALVPILPASRTMYAHTGAARVFIRLKRPSDTVESEIIFNEFGRASVVNSALPDNSAQEAIVVQGASALRTRLSFDLSQLPPFAAIHRAELVLPVDAIRSTVSNLGFPQSMQLYQEQNAEFPAVSRSFESQRNRISATSAVGFFDNTTGTARYIFSSNLNMASVVENIVKSGGKKNMMLQLRPEFVTQNGISRADEEQTTSRIVFYGLREQNLERRPRLVITYSPRYTVPR
jgi:hypothetical protein